MQKYDLDNFEFHINTNVWDAAQDLMVSGAVRAVHEVEKHFWTAFVEDFEVELLLSPRKIKGYTCDCWAEARQTPCKHVAAVAAQVRQYLNAKKEQKTERTEARQQAAEQRDKRMTVASMVQDISVDELRGFVADFSKTNRDFALAFKTRFAGTFETVENPYRKLLDSLLPEKGRKDYPLKRAAYLRVRRSLLELRDQARTSQQTGDFRTMTDLALPMLEYLGPLAAHSPDTQQRELTEVLTELAKMLERSDNPSVSPELKAEINDGLLFLVENIELPLPLLVPIGRHLSKKSAENQAVFDKIQGLFDKAPSPIPQAILLLYAAAMLAGGLEQSAINLFESLQVDTKNILLQCNLLRQMGYEQATAEILFHFLENEKITGWAARKVEDELLAISPKLKKASFLPSLLAKRFVESGQLRYLEDLKDRSDKRWPYFFEKIKAELIRNSAYEQLIFALAYVEDLTGIEHILTIHTELGLLDKAMPLLAEKHPEWLKKIYLTAFSKHLDTHFGPPAARHIAQDIAQIIQKGHLPLATAIAKNLLITHKNRATLPEELAAVFPKKRLSLRF